MRTLLILLSLLPPLCAFADDPVHLGSGKADGNSFSFTLSKAAVEALPQWGTRSGTTAVSPRYATEVARNQLKTLVPDGDNWRLGDVCLSDLREDRWAYLVRFYREYPPEIAVFGGEYLEIPVLLDGSTLKPTITFDERLKMRSQPLPSAEPRK
jgi:hypothetical protein